MQTQAVQIPAALITKRPENTLYTILLAISLSHLLNDTIQSLIPSIYPTVKESFHLNFTQVGLITLTFQLTASLLQPLVGFYTDRQPKPYSLVVGMSFTLLGLVLLSLASNFTLLLFSVSLVGLGSAIFHPEASRLAHLASGGRHGFAQSLFQVGGNAGTSLGPLLAALIIARRGQSQTPLVLLGRSPGDPHPVASREVVQREIPFEYKKRFAPPSVKTSPFYHQRIVIFSLVILMVLLFSKYFYLASLTSYYTFYLIDRFHLSIQSAQVHLFIFLFSVATGALIRRPSGRPLWPRVPSSGAPFSV